MCSMCFDFDLLYVQSAHNWSIHGAYIFIESTTTEFRVQELQLKRMHAQR